MAGEQPKISDEAVEAARKAFSRDYWLDRPSDPLVAALEATYPLLRQQWEKEADSHPTACGCPAEWVLCISHNMKTCGEASDG